MQSNKLLEGLNIIGSYYDEDDGKYWIVSEHDEIFAGHGLSVSEEDKIFLVDLGWIFDESLDCWKAFT
jgi:hypothetical protein